MQDAGNIIAALPHGQRFTSLETAFMSREKLVTGDQWLRVRTQLGGATQEGYVAAWLVHEVGAPAVVAAPSPSVQATWQDVINATFIACGRRGLNYNTVLDSVGFWNVFNPALRPLPYNGRSVESWALAADVRQAIFDLLKLSSAELVDQASQVATDSAQKQQDKVTQRESIIGIHGPPGVGCPPRSDWDAWIERLQSIGVRWYKQCDDGDPNHREIFEWAKRLKQAGIEPVIRYFADHQFPNPLPDHYFEKMMLYADADIKWAEIGNEPNIDYEWQQSWNGRVNYNDPEVIRLLAEGWVRDAQRAVAAGVRPALYALGPTDWRGGSHPALSSVYFASRLAIYLAEHRRDETIALFKQGAWFAVHCATFEQPNDFDALGQKPI